MTIASEQVAHSGLVGGGSTTLHSHSGGGGGADVKTGSETITEGSSATVTFATAFSATPNVVVGFSDNSAEISVCSVHTTSTTGCTIIVVKSGGGGSVSRDINWIASDAGNG